MIGIWRDFEFVREDKEHHNEKGFYEKRVEGKMLFSAYLDMVYLAFGRMRKTGGRGRKQCAGDTDGLKTCSRRFGFGSIRRRFS